MKIQEFLHKSALIVVLATLVCLTGCEEEKRIKAPPLNDHPVEKITFVIDIKSAQAGETYKVEGASVYYTTPTPGCGYMDYMAAIGGRYIRPEARIDFVSNGNEVTIYRDYFKFRQTCPFIITQVIIEISDQVGLSAGVNINSLVLGSRKIGHIKSKCEFESIFNYYLCTKEGESGFLDPPRERSFMVDVQRL